MPEKKPLEWSPRSQRNIEFIRDYIAANNTVAAQSVLDEIRRAAESLRNFPMLGHIGQRAGTRELVLSKYPYTLIYRLTQKKIGIVAVRTSHVNIHHDTLAMRGEHNRRVAKKPHFACTCICYSAKMAVNSSQAHLA